MQTTLRILLLVFSFNFIYAQDDQFRYTEIGKSFYKKKAKHEKKAEKLKKDVERFIAGSLLPKEVKALDGDILYFHKQVREDFRPLLRKCRFDLKMVAGKISRECQALRSPHEKFRGKLSSLRASFDRKQALNRSRASFKNINNRLDELDKRVQELNGIEERLKKLSAELLETSCNMAPRCSKNGIVNESNLRRTMEGIGQLIQENNRRPRGGNLLED